MAFSGGSGIGELFLAGVLDDQAWQAALARAAARLGAIHLIVQVQTALAAERFTVWAHGIDAAWLPGLRSWAPEFELLAKDLPVGRAGRQEEIVPGARYRRLGVQQQMVEPLGGFRAALARPLAGALIIACRGRADPPFRVGDLQRLEAALPAFARALELKCRVQALQRRLDAFELACHGLETGVVLFDNDGSRAYANPAAAEILGPPDAATGIQPDDWTPEVRTMLAGGQDAAVVLRREAAPPLVARVLQPAAATGASVLLLRAPARSGNAGTRAICRRLKLTPRETDIALRLAAGQGTAASAAALGISVGNLRVHLKHIFSKAEVRGRVELAALLQAP